MTTFVLPDLGEGLQEAEVVSWHVGEGDHVVADQPLVAVETEKAVVEIPSPQSGHVARLLARLGERVKVGAALLEFADGPQGERGTVVGELPEAPPAAAPARAPATTAAPGSAIKAAPAVRARAKALGVELASLTPSGPGGTITLADVEAATSAAASGGDALRGARRTMAEHMARAWREVVHATVQDEADIEAWASGEDVTCRVIRAIIAGCRAEPALNAHFDAASATLRISETIDLGLAVDAADGLFVPVLRDVARGTPESWRAEIEKVKRAVAERSLSPAALRGATITLSNFGAIAGRTASLIVMPPQVAILGVGRSTTRPVAAGGAIALHRALPLSLSIDHRAVTGGMASRFLAAVIRDLESAQ